MPPSELIAVDVGNSRMKLGRYVDPGGCRQGLPAPIDTLDLTTNHATGEFDRQRLVAWCDDVGESAEWCVASVHRAASERLAAVVSRWKLRQLTYCDIPLSIAVDAPDRVGIDRLLGAAAADRLRQPGRGVIVVDAGTAITIDLVDERGTFCGGAILPGIAMAARALEEQTDALPRVAADRLERPPAALGKSTVPAIESGLYWGAVGGIRELVHQLSATLTSPPDVLLTGGTSSHVVDVLAAREAWAIRHEAHLVLAGIALVASAAGDHRAFNDGSAR
jgi:type III pantothenate kinase